MYISQNYNINRKVMKYVRSACGEYKHMRIRILKQK